MNPGDEEDNDKGWDDGGDDDRHDGAGQGTPT